MELLERDSEVRRVALLSDATRAGSGRAIVFEGEAGIGKTELLRAAGWRFERDGLAVMRARGGELERGFGFGVVRQLFEPALAGIPARARRSLFSGAATFAGPVVGFEPVAAERRVPDPVFAAQHGLYWLVVNLASLRPLVLVIDDAQWSDPASLQWLLYLVRRLEGVPASVVVGWRSGEPDAQIELLEALRAEPLVEAIGLSGLTVEATSILVRRWLPAAGHELCEACHQATGGNPFLASELAAAVAAHDADVETGAEGAVLVTRLGPPAVARWVLARLLRLSSEAQALARAVAVLDTDADAPFVVELAGLEPGRLASVASSLIEARIFEDSDVLRFVHPILRAAVYADLSAPKRAAEHRRAAEVLLRLGGDPDRAAVHLLATSPTREFWVVRRLAEAAERAVQRGAPDAALVLLERALAEPPTLAERSGLLLARGVAAFMSAHPGAEEFLREAIADADSPAIRTEAAMTLSQLEVGAGRARDAVATLEQAISKLGDADPERAGRLELYRITTDAVQGAPWKRVQKPLECLRMAAAPGSWLRRVVCGCLIWQESLRPDGARPQVFSALRAELGDPAELAEDTGPLDFVYFSWAMMGLEQIDDLQRARAGLDAAAQLAQRTGHLAGLAPVLAARAPVLYGIGDLAGAEADARQATQIGPLVGNNVARDWGLATLCMVLTERGEHEAAERALAAQGLVRTEPGPSGLEARLFIGRATLRHAQGRHAEACADVTAYAARMAGYDGAAFGALPAICARILIGGGQTRFASALLARILAATAASDVDGVRGMAVHAQALLERDPTMIDRLQEAVRLPRRVDGKRAEDRRTGRHRQQHQRDRADPVRDPQDG